MHKENTPERISALRQEYLAKRSTLTFDEVKANSEQVCNHLINFVQKQRLQNIMIYLATKNEVDLANFISFSREAKINLAVPIMEQGEKSRISASLYLPEDENNLQMAKFGVWEPAAKRLVEADLFDMVLVPGLAFDRQGGRYGYGKGYYDSFLPSTKSNAILCGICHELQIADNLPLMPWDVPLDAICSEQGIFLV